MSPLDYLEEQKWERPDNYGGFSPDGDYVILTRNRDSNVLDACNWEAAYRDMNPDEGESDHPAVYTFRANHWAVGWVDYLMVRADAPEATRIKAGEIIAALGDYGILDEDLYSIRKYDAIVEYWAQSFMTERIEYLFYAGLSIFAARRDELPEDPHGRLFDRLRDKL